MKKEGYLEMMTNSEIIQMELKPKDNAMMALLENNLRLSLLAKHDDDLSEEKEKMMRFIVHKSMDFLVDKGLTEDEAGEILTILTVSIALQDKLNI